MDQSGQQFNPVQSESYYMGDNGQQVPVDLNGNDIFTPPGSSQSYFRHSSGRLYPIVTNFNTNTNNFNDNLFSLGQITLTDLDDGAEYNVYCQTQNRIGFSAPSETI